MPIVELGHTGVWVNDYAVMKDFYTRMMGLTITDEDEEKQMCFFSSRPDVEHHEFVIAAGRTAPEGQKHIQQISWRVDTLEELVDFHNRFKEEGVKVQQEVTHGNAYGIYFWDPEGNRVEVYVRIPEDVRQPFRKSLNFDQPVDDIVAEANRLLAEGGTTYEGAIGGAAKEEVAQ